MPIYAYRCEACGHTKDVLQKVSDPLLTVCPSCGAEAFQKQVTAAGFQLKGSGWYVTDFRGGNSKKAPAEKDEPASTDAAKPDAKPTETGSAEADAAPAPAPAPAPASGGAADKSSAAPASPAAASGPSTPSQ